MGCKKIQILNDGVVQIETPQEEIQIIADAIVDGARAGKLVGGTGEITTVWELRIVSTIKKYADLDGYMKSKPRRKK